MFANEIQKFTFAGHDYILGTEKPDYIPLFYAKNTTVIGAGGDDVIYGYGLNNVQIDAGNGNDFVSVFASNNTSIRDWDGVSDIRVGDSSNTTVFTIGTTADLIDVSGSVNTRVFTGDGTNTINITGSSKTLVIGGAGDDTVNVSVAGSTDYNSPMSFLAPDGTTDLGTFILGAGQNSLAFDLSGVAPGIYHASLPDYNPAKDTLSISGGRSSIDFLHGGSQLYADTVDPYGAPIRLSLTSTGFSAAPDGVLTQSQFSQFFQGGGGESIAYAKG
jgi:hypothetical protein